MWGSGLLNGLRITMRNMLRGPITIKYPYEKYELPERARWAVAPTFNDEGNHKCTACMNCVRTCPDHILDLQVETREDKSKHIEHFVYEIGACMMCGLCVEACPFDAIHMGHDYELAVVEVDELVYDLLTDVEAVSARAARAEKKPAAETPKTEASKDETPTTERPATEGGEADA